MKKFLFTLVALFAAGTMMADNYFYIDNFEVPTAKLGGTVKVNVKAHFDQYVSSWQVDLGTVDDEGNFTQNVLPEGITKVTSAAGADMKNMTYVGDDGEEYSDYSPNLKKGMDGTRIIVAADQGNYSPDGELYGCVKWAPGEYNQMWTFTFTFAEDFKGGKLGILTAPSCGTDTRPEITPCPKGETYFQVTEITVEAPAEVVAPVPTLNWDENELVMQATCENHEVVLMIGDQVVANPYLVEQTTEEQTITFTAYTVANTELGETANSATVEQTVVVPAKEKTPSAKPGFAFDLQDEYATITVTGNNISDITVAGTDNYTIEGNVVTIPRPAYNEDAIVVTVTATNTDEGWVTPTTATSDEYTVAPKAEKVYQTKTPVVTVTQGEDAYTLTATCEDEGEVVLVVQYINNETGDMETVRYPEGTTTIARTDADQVINYWAEATANTPAGYDSVAPASSEVEYYYVIPAKEQVVPEQTAKPEITYVVDEENQKVIVTATGNGTVILYNDDQVVATGEGKAVYEVPFTEDPEGEEMGFSATAQEAGKTVSEYALATIEIPGKQPVITETTLSPAITATPGNQSYTVTVTNNADEPDAVIYVSVDGGDFVVYTGPITFDTFGPHTVAAYAQAPGKNKSNDVTVTFIVDENTKPDPSAVNELNGEKTVAGVRYFNMAGQEMQEANGMTIVVTTYTDGTTSAVKVMK